MTDANEIRAQRFAGRLLAEGYTPQATDRQMHDAFAGCVKPCSPTLYPAIRDAARDLEREKVQALIEMLISSTRPRRTTR